MLRVQVTNKSERKQFEHADGPLEFGRGPRRATARCVLEDPFVSGDQLRVSETTNGKIQLDNLSGRNPVTLGEKTSIAPGAVLEGPIWIGEDVEVRAGAYLRGGCWIGNGCVVGANVEMKRAILFDGAHAAHLNYVGDSILGRGVNLGAGVICSNFRHDGKPIEIPHPEGRIATGRRKLGAIVGDGAAVGCNAVLNPGTIVGARSQIYTGVQLRSGVYPAGSMIKLRQSIEVVPRGEE